MNPLMHTHTRAHTHTLRFREYLEGVEASAFARGFAHKAVLVALDAVGHVTVAKLLNFLN